MYSNTVDGFTKVSNSDFYKIKHTHKLKNKQNQIVEFSGYFILDYEFELNMVELENTNSLGGAFPPRIEVWTNLFAKKLSLEDSIRTNKIRKEKMNESFDIIKEAIKSENISDEEKDQLKGALKALDTLKDN